MRTIGLVVVLALAGCGGDAPPPKPRAPTASELAFTSAQRAWRAERNASLRAPDGWLSLIGLHWIDPGPHYVGSARDNGIRIAIGPAQLGMIDLRGDHVRFVPASRTTLVLDDAPFKRAATLRADDDPAGPSKIVFDDGKGVATVIKRGGRYALRVRHADAPTRAAFTGLTYWPGGEKWVVDARLKPHPAGTKLRIANIVGIEEDTPNPGVVEFRVNGNDYRLEALEGEGGGLFVIFADRTSGHGSYGAGRFLDTLPPTADGRVRLDFNQAYNPPCAFTLYATCPLPPATNRLNLSITAGEKNYAGHK